MTQCDQSNQIILILFWLLSWAVLLFCWFRRKWPFSHSDSDWIELACWLFMSTLASLVWQATIVLGILIGVPVGVAWLAHQVRKDDASTGEVDE